MFGTHNNILLLVIILIVNVKESNLDLDQSDAFVAAKSFLPDLGEGPIDIDVLVALLPTTCPGDSSYYEKKEVNRPVRHSENILTYEDSGQQRKSKDTQKKRSLFICDKSTTDFNKPANPNDRRIYYASHSGTYSDTALSDQQGETNADPEKGNEEEVYDDEAEEGEEYIAPQAASSYSFWWLFVSIPTTLLILFFVGLFYLMFWKRRVEQGGGSEGNSPNSSKQRMYVSTGTNTE